MATRVADVALLVREDPPAGHDVAICHTLPAQYRVPGLEAVEVQKRLRVCCVMSRDRVRVAAAGATGDRPPRRPGVQAAPDLELQLDARDCDSSRTGNAGRRADLRRSRNHDPSNGSRGPPRGRACGLHRPIRSCRCSPSMTSAPIANAVMMGTLVFTLGRVRTCRAAVEGAAAVLLTAATAADVRCAGFDEVGGVKT